ncbi:Hsp33 family molecular chaperone HslO [Chitinasiproducens palmae]|uniref:Molecular chaperone Hsp33 n=1 Tax=Chitinasiproducens palmae TaxID=1770053 RepID=A0A1H2PR04_9BURK|nr:Hsp33 family molecular chaperone HslO [Chitinasiproducens palmae]SDV49295.1 molecular chaperone Hsp33 [Chitinasiproducens palmae]
MTDQLQKFMFDKAPVRGEIVSLEDTWREVLARHDYPPAIVRLLGEMMAAAALLSATLKFDGSLIIQIHGDGPVRMLVVQCDSELNMRATATLADGDVQIDDDATLTALVNVGGGGRCAITLDPRDKQRGQQAYQGIVPLSDDDHPEAGVATVLQQYMRRSEQLDTRIWLAADDKRAVGMMLQKMPGDGGIALPADELDADTWDRVCHLGATLSAEELLGTDSDRVLKRLFWEETLRYFEPNQARFKCTCSRLKVANMLRMLGREEVDGIIEERGEVETHCDFCNQRYAFDAVDVAQVFASATEAGSVTPASEQRH